MEYDKEEVRERFKELFEYSLDLIYVNDLNGNFLDANDITLISLGYNHEDIQNISFIDLLDRENLIKAYKVTKEIRKFGRQNEWSEYKIKSKGGDYIFIDTYGIPLKKNGKIYAILGIGKNVTERKVAELKLKDSEKKYRDMINNLDAGFYQVTLDGIMLNHNPAHNKIMGYDPAESLSGRNVHMFWQYPEQRNAYKEKILKDGFARNYICHAQTRTGKKIIVELNSHLILDVEGNPIRIDGTLKDITEKYILSEKLRVSEQKYRYLYENTPFSIVLINSQGIIVDCNQKTKPMFDYNRVELIGKKIQEIDAFFPSDLTKITTLFKRFLKGEELHRLEIRVRKKDGTLIWVSLQASVMKIGEKTYVEALFTDITAKKEAELLVNEEIRKLKELEKIRKNLISRVSHELKTPLVSINGGAELLLKVYNKDFSSEALEILELIEKGGKRLKHLVESLVDISKNDYGKFELEINSEDLSEIISECSREITYLLRNRKINLNLLIPDSLYMKLDRIRIEQVVINLLSNAIKNSPPNGEVNIILKKNENSNWVDFIVSDNGIGFTKEEMNSLFTRFGKIERYGEGFEYLDIQGSGLGLFIVKEIVNLHGGVIEAFSDGRSKGAKFIVRLPIN
ncbi:MAG: PAS domain S-box protein [Promethearchaeota archaeon]